MKQAQRRRRMRAPVTRRALTQRINRKLARSGRGGEVLRANRSEHAYPSLGEFYLVDAKCGAVVRTHVDLDELGRELEVLQPWERIE